MCISLQFKTHNKKRKLESWPYGSVGWRCDVVPVHRRGTGWMTWVGCRFHPCLDTCEKHVFLPRSTLDVSLSPPISLMKTCSRVRIKKKEKTSFFTISDWAFSPLRVPGKEAGLERRACKNHVSLRLRRRVTWWLARGNGGFRRERGFWRRRQHRGGIYDLLQ